MIPAVSRPEHATLVIRPVDSFYSSAMPDADPHRYPGERPETSFLTDGTDVMPITFSAETSQFEVTTTHGVQAVDDWLDSQGATKLEDRIPVVSYGANLCPKTLRKKLTYEGRPDLQIVPTVYGWMDGVDVVWHERPSLRGSFFAELYAGPEVANTKAEVGVTFLTPEQLLFIHKTEANYDFGQFSTIEITPEMTIPALLYVGSAGILLKDGKPIGVEGVKRQNAVLSAGRSKDMLAYVLQFPEVRAVASEAYGIPEAELTPDTYTQAALALPAGKRKMPAVATEEPIRALGLAGTVSMSAAADHRFSWSNPSTLPTWGLLTQEHVHAQPLIRLPEQEVQLASSEEGREQRQVVLRAVQKHMHARKPQ